MTVTSREPASRQTAEGAFLRAHPAYERTAILAELRRSDYVRLDRGGDVYLEYAGGGLFASCLLREHMALLESAGFGNPHSVNPTSAASTELFEHARASALEFFTASPDEYIAIFTPNATGALRLVGEAYPFDPGVVCAPRAGGGHVRRRELLRRPAPAARRDALAKLRRPWFSGGTIVAAFVGRQYYQSAPCAAHFEDRTVNYVSLPAVQIGLRFMRRIGIETIHARVGALGDCLLAARIADTQPRNARRDDLRTAILAAARPDGRVQLPASGRPSG